jgi:hypothetical protein
VEAAHLVAVADEGGYDVGNGIFLSVNWHQLMDRGILFQLLYLFTNRILEFTR